MKFLVGAAESGSRRDQEVLHYLEHVREVWHRLLRGDKAALQKVDQDTVKALELRAPRYSRRESLLLYGQMLSGQIFGAFSREEREEIWLDLRSIDGLIPSLFTFFEDLKYLSAPANCLKQLVHVSRRDTLRTAFQRKFAYSEVAEEQSIIEVAESTFSVKAGTMGNRFDLCYRQLWLFAMRHYKAIPIDASKKGKDLLAKAGPEKADEAILSDFVVLAQRLGFESKEIQELSRQSSDWQIARNALLKARKPDRYRYNEAHLEDYVGRIVELFMTATPLPVGPLSPVLVSGDPDAAGNRCGFPDEDAQEQDSRFLFLPYLHDEGSEVGQEITSFFVRRSVYQAFFGKISDLALENIPDYLLRGYPSSSQTIISTSELSQSNDVECTDWQISRTTQPELHETGGQRHEQLEQQRVEIERLERLEQQRLEQEQREKEQRERDQREKEQREKEQHEKEQREKDQREKDQREKEEQEKEQREKEEQEKEQREKEQREKEQREKEQREKEVREQEQQRLELLVLRRLEQDHEQDQREKDQREKDQREKDQRNQEELETRRLEKEKFDQESAMHESFRQKSVASGGGYFRHVADHSALLKPGVDAKKPPLDDKRHTPLQKPVNQPQVPEQRVGQRGLNSNPKPTNLKPTKKYGGGVLRSDEDNDGRIPRTLMNDQSARQRVGVDVYSLFSELTL
ncbi:hypothetical protein LTR84_001271 [Exophiala bonariae]|uniref:Uncharacterized protein n=1 Tax=Exophiala bonariae TaxID=1690606 RepID=A0AAV9NWZ2_9EURO|nr:hypothetical protein LTR84_001271 [Exophiala bonariae]